MTEFETFEAIMLALDMAVTASMNFLAIVITYLVAAFVVGKSLPRSVAIGTSAIYTLFLIPPFGGTIGNLRRTYEGGLHLQSEYPDSWTILIVQSNPDVIIYFFAIPMFVGWLGSIFYMHRIVRSEIRRVSSVKPQDQA